MSQDTLSDVLRGVRLRGAVFFYISGHSEWVAEAASAKEIAPLLMRGVEHVMEYHAVAQGSCGAGIPDGPCVQAAGRLLLETRATVATIALDVGYESEAAFSRAFKRLIGQPPAAWRRERDAALALGAGAAFAA